MQQVGDEVPGGSGSGEGASKSASTHDENKGSVSGACSDDRHIIVPDQGGTWGCVNCGMEFVSADHEHVPLHLE